MAKAARRAARGVRRKGLGGAIDRASVARVLAQVERVQQALAASVPSPAPSREAAAREPSGRAWVRRFPGRRTPQQCASPFRESLRAFLAALRAAGASVVITSTLRPPQRAYLMHWCWRIARGQADPREVPAMEGVAIDWLHRDAAGAPDLAQSRTAAQQMVEAYDLVARPSLRSRHTEGRAVDMTVTWKGTLVIRDQDGRERRIATPPRSGLHPQLHACGRTYGVIKAAFDDPPHWSDDGR